MLPVVILLVSHAMADIIVQPGYGQPRTPQSHSKSEHHPIVEPPELIPHTGLEDQKMEVPEPIPHTSVDHHEHNTEDADYHLELHPVYSNEYHIPAHALSPMYQHPTLPPMSRAAYRKLLARYGGLGVSGIPAAPYYYPYLPPAVHSRRRRSNTGGLDAAAQRDKRDKDDVATESSLGTDTLSVIDSQSQEEKRVNSRQSVTGTLLGLNPANMYPVYKQYSTMELDPTLNSHQEIANPQTVSQINSRATTQEQSVQQQAASSAQTAIPRMNIENLQHAMLLQYPNPQLQRMQEISEQRNAPDPRPISTSVQSASDLVTVGSMDGRQSRTTTVPKHAEAGNDEEIVGTKFRGVHKVKVHLHQHAKFKDAGHKSAENYAHANPSYVKHNDETPNNLAVAQTGASQMVQVYQLPGVQGTSYNPNAQYIVMPQTYPVTYTDNYVWGNSYTPKPLPYTICLETPDNVQPIVYQLV